MSLTVTPMATPSLMELWGDLHANQPVRRARTWPLPIVQTAINGKTSFVARYRIVDFGDKLLEAQLLCMGDGLAADIAEGQRRLTC